jgi:hypothetical protein
MNTGDLLKQQQKLAFLRKQGIRFLDNDVEKTISLLQIPTKYTDQDIDSLIKLVAPIKGEIKLVDKVAWIYLKHEDGFTLLQKGLFYILFGLSYFYTYYFLEEILMWNLYYLT